MGRSLTLLSAATLLASTTTVTSFVPRLVLSTASRSESEPVRLPASMFSSSSSQADSGFSDKKSEASNGNDADGAFERKNASRKKFGLSPLTLQQFDDIEVQVASLEKEQKAKAFEMATARSASKQRQEAQKQGLFDGMFDGILQDTCESNEDCERPQVCCDLVVRKMCCSSGMGIRDEEMPMELIPALVPVPVTVPDWDKY